jgi:cytochrome oxidase assembly protein ShyY1
VVPDHDASGDDGHRWRFLFKPKWIAGHLLVLLLTGSFIALGIWQLDRNTQKHDKDAAAKAAFAAPAPPIGRTDPTPGARVQAAGHYDRAGEALLRNRVHNGQPGYELLTPLRLADGTAIVVDRGWVPQHAIDGPAIDGTNGDRKAFPAPTGAITVRGLAATSSTLQPQDTVEQHAGRTSLPRADLQEMQRGVPYALRGVYLVSQYRQPAAPNGLPALPVPPPSDEVNHMEYALQWFAFALIGIIGWPIVLWRVSRRTAPTRSLRRSPSVAGSGPLPPQET